MDVFNVLQKEHDEIRQMFDTLLKQDHVDQQQLQLLCYKLLIDMDAKERFLYPELEKTGDAGMYKMEHDAARAIIDSLQKPNMGDLEIKTKLQAMKIPGDMYANMLENTTFKKAREVLSEQQLQDLGQQVENYIESRMQTFQLSNSPATAAAYR